MESCLGTSPQQPEVLILNARAISKMACGQFKEAIELLKVAIRQAYIQFPLNRALFNHEGESPLHTRVDTMNSQVRLMGVLGNRSTYGQMVPISGMKPESQDVGPSWYQGNGLIIYDLPCLLQTCSMFDMNDDKHTATTVKESVVALLFNYGLSLHLCATYHNRDEACLLNMALNVYSKTLAELENRESVSIEEWDERDRVLFMMITLNNIACIYSDLFLMDSASQRILDMKQVLQFATMYRSTFEHAYARCQLNAWFWPTVKVRCAPAA